MEYIENAARSLRFSAEGRMEIVNWVAGKPSAGVAIEGTGGARKVRFTGKSKGKRGGYRVLGKLAKAYRGKREA